MIKHILIAASAIGLLTACTPAEPPTAQSEVSATLPSEAEIAGLFDRWNAALATGNPETVAALYASDGVLEPTVSNNVRTTREEIRDYFTEFLRLRPQGVINERYIDILGSEIALDQGVYTFDLTDPNGNTRWVTARYTFVYTKENGEWRIEHHHSSAMPEPVATRPAPLAATAPVSP